MNYQEQIEHYKAVKIRISGVAPAPQYMPMIVKVEPEPVAVEIKPKANLGFREQIISDCAEEFKITVNDLLSPKRTKECAQRGTMSYPQIGRLLNRDHTTIIHAVRRYQESLV
jgi:hypothetical protein